ncbi:MAG: hypothetical protein PVH18_07310 [Chloroflexota bacterium]
MNKKRIGPLLLAIGIPLLVIGLLFFAAGDVKAVNPSVTLEQCANGGSNLALQCAIDPGGSIGWVTGNANAQKSTYQIGQFIAYRFIFDDLLPGYAYCGAMAWDVAQSGKPAIDYIATFSETMTNANPTLGTNFLGFKDTPSQTVPIPADPVLITGTMQGNPFTGVQEPGTVNIWGGTFITYLNASKARYPAIYDNLGDNYGDLASGGAAGAQAIEYCFVPVGDQVLIALSGHIARSVDWGNLPRPSGSPYHMRFDSNGGFTPPRISVNDLAEVLLPFPPGVVVGNYNIGNIEVQLDVAEPTAITLQNISASDGSAGAGLAIAVVGLLAAGTGLILVLRKRQPVEVENRID